VLTKHAALTAFGTRIRKLRRGLGLSQEELAHRAGFDRTYVSMIELGQRNVTLWNICRFAAALGETPRDLMPDLPPPREKGPGRAGDP